MCPSREWLVTVSSSRVGLILPIYLVQSGFSLWYSGFLRYSGSVQYSVISQWGIGDGFWGILAWVMAIIYQALRIWSPSQQYRSRWCRSGLGFIQMIFRCLYSIGDGGADICSWLRHYDLGFSSFLFCGARFLNRRILKIRWCVR